MFPILMAVLQIWIRKSNSNFYGGSRNWIRRNFTRQKALFAIPRNLCPRFSDLSLSFFWDCFCFVVGKTPTHFCSISPCCGEESCDWTFRALFSWGKAIPENSLRDCNCYMYGKYSIRYAEVETNKVKKNCLKLSFIARQKYEGGCRYGGTDFNFLKAYQTRTLIWF